MKGWWFPLLLLLLWVSACAPTRNELATPTRTATAIPTSLAPTQTITPMVGPTLTSTPVPPLVAHQWTQSEPLVTFNSTWFDGYCGFEDAYPIRFTLFPNGELYDVGSRRAGGR